MATTNDLTRQQLDELDLLLQRMLTGPVEKPVSMPVPKVSIPEAPTGWRVDPPSPPAVPHFVPPPMPVVEPPTPSAAIPEVGPAPQPFMPTPLMPLERPKPIVEAMPVDVPVPDLPEIFNDIEMAELTPAVPSSSDAFEPARTNSIPPILWPIYSVNWLLENTLKLFGPPGEMLCSRAGKNLLGTVGVLMILGAGIWAVQGQGWIRLPMELLKR